MSVYKLVCPACGGKLRIRNSEGESPIFRSIYGQCMSIACGATFAGSQSWEYELSPSGLDKPRVQLPVAPSVTRMKALRESRAETDQLDLLDTLPEEAFA
ncbi:TPA: ogr/Delta-like zinc finger family protein [Pseudomonas aeruginosa]|uniref:ogr/Delta-like zinc finger family protein n=1 Tax=Pseudomonas nitroreducens TaxID=46680 RepID=UPI00244D6BD7|nr:ogr/Delta-like zinc finger family protein [Pseudomonas nitroreducens]HCK4503001.1 ogr/Delta-like zinc finger family protein [Pseudomonas aeruginosa]MDG9854141.1 ogr/Delta-like zinc finger family protein [Pseudomonas nitroreducens]HCK4574094.1 ogr/Delta-like zinc finger family protein [Pseudomonas aeruginosa]HCK4790537.1 ogr/Delta-like zinc finger family protein [Pseudomonas aeruginosa]HCK4799651.1 ogr/Delta-like zinc finger family protein [Pseudomonas aeruginosa]